MRHTSVIAFAALAITVLTHASPVAAHENAVVVDGTLVAILFILGTISLKIAAVIIGYLVVRLGHDTLVRSITGELDFGFEGNGIRAKLKSASPGAAFILAGAAVIIWALAVDKPFDIQIRSVADSVIDSAEISPVVPQLPE